MSKLSTLSVLILAVVAINEQTLAQDPTRFAEQVAKYQEEKIDPQPRPIIFVGSSSIRMWKTLRDDYLNQPVFNRGFGGSQMSDLHFYCHELVIRHQPRQVFIYEGDNDLGAGKSLDQILDTTELVVKMIKEAIPDVNIVFISPKPSLARFNLRQKYVELNEALREFASTDASVSFADVWHPMLGENGLVRSDIFIEDGLHMNAQGYAIWKEVLEPFLVEGTH